MAIRPTGGTRAKDADREDTCKLLDDALTDGQLSMTEHRQRVADATKATTLSQLQTLVADLQNAVPDLPESAPAPRPRLPVWLHRWYLPVAAGIVTLLTGVLIGWGIYGNTSSPLSLTSDPGAQPDGIAPTVLTPPRQLHSLGGLTGLLEQMRQRFGDTTGYELVIYPDYASLDRTDPSEPRRALNYVYRGGWGDPSEAPASANSGRRVVDLAKFDVAKFVGVLRGAAETVGIKPSEVKSTYVIIRSSENTLDAPDPPDAVKISVYVTNQFNTSGYIELDADLNPMQVHYA